MAGTIETIRPLTVKRELFILISITILVLLFGIIAINKKGNASQYNALKSYQLSAFDALSNKEQMVFTWLFGAGYEIEKNHIENLEQWPTPVKLEQNYIPPFVKDLAWRQNGRFTWNYRIVDVGKVHQGAYLGKANDTDVPGVFLLILEHYHSVDGAYQKSGVNREPFRIWYRSSGFEGFPEDFSAGNLIKKGWREVIPYRGREEAKKLGRK